MKKEMPPDVKEILDCFVEGAKQILGEHLQKVILYGSYARGDYNESSDIDIMVLTDLNEVEIEKYKIKIVDYSWEIEWKRNFKIALSPLVKNIEKYNKRIDVVPFYRNVHKEGVVWYG